jgi:hypothetical protein
MRGDVDGGKHDQSGSIKKCATLTAVITPEHLGIALSFNAHVRRIPFVMN